MIPSALPHQYAACSQAPILAKATPVDQYPLASSDFWKQDIGIADAVGTPPRLAAVTVAAASTAIANRLSLVMPVSTHGV